MTSYILTLSCKDRQGLVARVAAAIASFDGNIVEASQFNEEEACYFFMRVRFDLDQDREPAFSTCFAELASEHGMTWSFRPTARRKKVLIFVSKFDHCLGDLIYRNRIGELDMDIVGVVSNHPKQSLKISNLDDLPFFHFPVTTKTEQEDKIKDLVVETNTELVILARYMQILSDDLARFLSGRCINIHHSFLPGFKGAKPYHQAHSRGVKMIGATAHYVTSDLDEGPIIHQDVERITHADSADDLVRKGRDIERRVLATAAQLHLEDRVLVHGAKTIIFAQ